MNGRVYDYNLGRFLSVDPLIQATGNSQSINPYSYLMNNPLSGTDPTGYAGEEVEEIPNEGKVGKKTKKEYNFGSHIKGGGRHSSGNGASVSMGTAVVKTTPDKFGVTPSTNENQELSNAIHPTDPVYQAQLDGMNSLFKGREKGPGSDFESEAEIITLLDDVVHPYAASIKMEIGTDIYGTENGKLTFAPLVLADNGNPSQVDTERSISGLRIAPARVIADWHSHAGSSQQMSGADSDLAKSLNRTSYVSSSGGIATFKGVDYNQAVRANSDAYKYTYKGKAGTRYFQRSPAVNDDNFYSFSGR